MKVFIKGKINPEENAAETILEQRGLGSTWLEAGSSFMLDAMRMRNFSQGRGLILKHLENKIGIYVDSDTDGFCSSAMMYLWLKRRNPNANIEVIIPEGKVHGIIKQLIPTDLDLLVVPDASSSEALIHKELMKNGMDILVLDHHEFNLENGEYATIINPQHPDCKYSNKSISGTGVVYKFIEAMDTLDVKDYYSDLIDLAAIATVADVMSLTSYENKAIVNKGLSDLKNPYFATYYSDNKRISEKTMNPTTVSFYLVPPINALIRLGTPEQKKNLFEAIIGELPAEMVVADILRVKSSHDNKKEPLLTRIKYNVQKADSNRHNILLAETPSNTPKSMTGVLAGQLTNVYMKPIFLGRKENGVFIGSARNINNSPVKELKDFCLDSGLFNFAAGHQPAFGFSIDEDKIEAFLEYCDEKLPPYEPVYYVDFKLGGDKGKVITEIASLVDHVGPGFPDILVYDEVFVEPHEISYMGQANNHIKFQKDGIEYLQFKFTKQIPSSKMLWKIVGKPSLNHFNGKITPQIIIEAWEAESVEL